MPRAREIRIAFIMAAAFIFACPEALSQNGAEIQQLSGTDLLLIKLSPTKWGHEASGDVRSIEITEYKLEKKSGQTVETPYGGKKTLLFDRRGFETEAIEDEESRIVWKYDAAGRVAEMHMWLGGLLLTRDLYIYDLTRRRVTVESYNLGSTKPLLRDVAIFDERWNQIRKETERFGDGEDSQPSKDVVVYNLTYDAKGRVIASSIADERGTINSKFTSEFDDSNRLIKSTYYDYDAATGTLITRSVNTYEKGGLSQTYSAYDSRGRLLRREAITREVDARGNWITERKVMWVYDQGPPSSFTLIKRRKITYY